MGALCCDLEVDVNGEETFMIDKNIILSFSARFRKLFCKELANTTGTLKVILHDFPGGAEGFEHVVKFCYNNGRIEITPSNIILFHFASHFMELESDDSSTANLKPQIEKSFEGISFWTWSELILILKQCQDLFRVANTLVIIRNISECLINRLRLPRFGTLYTSSSENSSFWFSCDTRSIESLITTKCSQTSTWWFEDLLFMNINLVDEFILRMISHKIDHETIAKFLFYYQKSRSFGATQVEKHKILEVVINLLCLLDRNSLSCKGSFFIYQEVSTSKMRKIYKHKLEILIGSQLDKTTIDYLLIKSPSGKDYEYDVNLILRLVKLFLLENRCFLSMVRLKRVAGLMDLYLMEVAADSNLRASKFAALAMALPHPARESHDKIYLAIDLYLEVHKELCEEQKIELCCAMNNNKLSIEALKHLAQNTKFPSRTAVIKALISKQSNPKYLFRDSQI